MVVSFIISSWCGCFWRTQVWGDAFVDEVLPRIFVQILYQETLTVFLKAHEAIFACRRKSSHVVVHRRFIRYEATTMPVAVLERTGGGGSTTIC